MGDEQGALHPGEKPVAEKTFKEHWPRIRRLSASHTESLQAKRPREDLLHVAGEFSAGVPLQMQPPEILPDEYYLTKPLITRMRLNPFWKRDDSKHNYRAASLPDQPDRILVYDGRDAENAEHPNRVIMPREQFLKEFSLPQKGRAFHHTQIRGPLDSNAYIPALLNSDFCSGAYRHGGEARRRSL